MAKYATARIAVIIIHLECGLIFIALNARDNRTGKAIAFHRCELIPMLGIKNVYLGGRLSIALVICLARERGPGPRPSGSS